MRNICPPRELPELVLVAGWDSFFSQRFDPRKRAQAEKLRNQLQEEILPEFLPTQRWFAAKDQSIVRVEAESPGAWIDEGETWLFLWLKVHFAQGQAQEYFLPLSLVWCDDAHLHEPFDAVLAKVRQGAQCGVLCDAFADQRFCQALVRAMGAGRQIPLVQGRLVFSATGVYPELVGDADELTLRHPSAAGSNSSVILGDRVFLKGYRRLQQGVNPEPEMVQFLTEVSPFSHIAALAGTLEFKRPDGNSMTLALLQGCISNQGDGWSYTLDYLERFLEQNSIAPVQVKPALLETVHDSYLMLMRHLGQRTGELHQALAKPAGKPAFDPEPVTSEDLGKWRDRVLQEAVTSLEQLRQCRESLPERLHNKVDWLLTNRAMLLQSISASMPSAVEANKTRYHGDYHLGQVLVAGNEFFIIDFEGEPARPLLERRVKSSPLKDVAGMLRSFSYAAHASVQRVSAKRPGVTAVLEPYAHEWARRTSAAFLNGYLDTVRESELYPRDEGRGRGLITLFTLEKMLYELRYELANRPDWVDIPLEGLIDFVTLDYSRI